jgi:hypothetical protein
MECKFCKNIFKTNSNLNNHMKTAIYCIKLQNKNDDLNIFKCTGCTKEFTIKCNYERHIKSCKKNSIINDYIKEINELKTIIERDTIYKSQYEKQIVELKDHVKELESKLENIAIQANNDNQLKIQHLTKKYVKKLPRVQYEEKNVIYIVTTERLKKDNIYVLGKANNLTSRLSTYNKSDEHEVVYYQQCSSEDKMTVVENMVFTKLEQFRESANRERFILPKDSNIDTFINTIKECVKFLC